MAILPNRQAIHYRYRELLDARPGNRLTPALDLALSIQDLSGPQEAMLDHLLAVFADHPKARSMEAIMSALKVRTGIL
jgi:hypothetical protein